MKTKRFVSTLLALLLICGLPVSAFAEEYDLANGSISVTADDSGQYVTQENGVTNAQQTTPTVITQSDSSTPTTNTVTITATENAAANVTIQDVNIVISTSSEDTTNYKGQAAVTINADAGATANVTLDGVSIDTKNTGGSYYMDGSNASTTSGYAAIQVVGNGNATLELDGENTVQSGIFRAGVEKNDADSSGNFTITDENETQGSLNATGGHCGAGIGGRSSGDSSNITITGSAEVIATGGREGAGIGGGYYHAGNNITITGSAEVTATGGESASGIGGGYMGSGNNITVSEDAQVKAQGGKVWGNLGTGAAIGNGGGLNKDGAEVSPNTDDLNEGWVATYAPGTTDLDTATPNSLTYKDASGTVQTATKDIQIEETQSATCTEDGHQAGFSVDGALVAVTIPHTGHNVPNGYTPQNDATCTELGTMKGYCTNCKTDIFITDPNSTLKDHTFTTYTPDPDNLATCTEAGTKTAVCDDCGVATQTVTDPAKGHSFTNYISDKNATYEADGTKTAKCDHCDATDTVTDPGSRLVKQEETAQAQPLYRVIGQDGKALSCKTEQSSGVLTITADADFAALTGNVSGMKTLKAQGVDTIVFVTKGATSTFAVEDLLSQGASGDTYQLTHDGAAVSFTLGAGKTDVSDILAKP